MQNTFTHYGYQIINNAITIETATIIANGFINLRNFMYMKHNVSITEFSYGNDDQVINSFSQYGTPTFDALLEYLLPTVESVTGKELWPTYSYARIYYPGAEMASHTDRPSCEYSMTLTLQTSGDTWPIYFRDRQGDTKEVIIMPGSGCIYCGMELPHWRSPYLGNQQVQVFLHYVDKNGPHANLKYDQRSMLGIPATQ